MIPTDSTTAISELRHIYDNMSAAYPLTFASKSFEEWRAEIQARVKAIERFPTAPADGKVDSLNGWLPIESVHDHKNDLLLWNGERVFMGWHDKDGWRDSSNQDYRDELEIPQPTHWQPLPAAPTLKASSGGEG